MSSNTAWGQMMSRCYDPAHPKYERYGGRGIRVCDRWICRRLFLEDMGERPAGMSLIRNSHEVDYCPENCQWRPYKQYINGQAVEVKKEVEITKELLEEMFTYRDGELYWRVDRGNVKAGQKAGALNRRGYIQLCLLNKHLLAHRLIFLMHHGYLPPEIDHIDSNPSNNKIENLREATHEQNIANVGLRVTNSSGYKNVSFDAKKKKWKVSMRVNKTTYHGGSFSSIEDANQKAIQMRNELSREFANHGRLV